MEFITNDEKQTLTTKLQKLKDRRPELSKRIGEARALGDLKENAEYHAARDDQAMDEAEIRRLEEKLKNAQVTDDAHIPEGMVFVGSVVRLRDTGNGSEDVYKLAGLGSDSSSLPTGGTFLWRDRLSEMVTAANQGERTALALPVKALFAETEPARMTLPPAERS